MKLPALAVLAAIAAVAIASPATAGVTVVDDEVFFALVAPGAKEVYLVGDFNNWNATVEKMRKTGDRFEISLFLVEGSYRYKFVVDGRYIVDPENPGDPSRGSPLVLVEKPAGMVLLTSLPEEEKAAPALAPWARYVGQYRWNSPEDDGFADRNVFNLGFDIAREKLRGQAVLKWSDADWERYVDTGGVVLDWGFVGTDVGGLALDAFTDTRAAWTSLDPTRLVGDVGVFDYNAGYRRNGFAADYRFADAFHVRGLYADDMGKLSVDQPVIPVAGLTAASSGADTTAYAVDHNPADSDVLGLEVFIDAKDFQCGIVSRRNIGRFPGTMADVSFADSTARVYDTRQDTDATFYWLRVSKLFDTGVTIGYGRGNAEINQLTQESQSLYAAGELAATQASSPFDARLEFETSERFYAALDRTAGRASGRAWWDRVTFDFDGTVFQPSEATVDRVNFDFDWTDADWTAGLRLRYTDPDYGKTPQELLVDSPALNMWLDWRDKFGVADIVGIGDDPYTDLVASGTWYPGRSAAGADSIPYLPRTWPDVARWKPPFARLELGTTTHRFFDGMRYNRARLTLAYVFRGRVYAMTDGRAARYDVEAWGDAEIYLSGYVEAGYLHRWFNVNLGWGFDPVVFDPVVSDYMDIGRTRWLRQSLESGVTRDGAAATGAGLLSLEKQLQAVQTIKLELVVYF
jgi:hypothetical protein